MSHPTIPIRDSVRVLILNDDELLLMCIDDAAITSREGEYNGPFWTPIGGQIEPGETAMEAAAREVIEETGLRQSDVEFGPSVWRGELDLQLSGVLTHIRQEFIVARTRKRRVSLVNLTPSEMKVVKRLEWFSLDRIRQRVETIYPVLLPEYLPAIIAGNYPDTPIEIDLAARAR